MILARLIACLLALWPGALAHAQDRRAVSITILEHGIYTAEVRRPGERAGNDLKPAGLAKICHVMTTLVVPARDKLQFGFRFRVDGAVRGVPVDLRKTIRYPDHSKPPTSPEVYALYEAPLRIQVGASSYAGWLNDRTRPGIWTFEFFEADRRLTELSFTVVDKGDIAVRPDSDSTCFNMSSVEHGTPWSWI